MSRVWLFCCSRSADIKEDNLSLSYTSWWVLSSACFISYIFPLLGWKKVTANVTFSPMQLHSRVWHFYCLLTSHSEVLQLSDLFCSNMNSYILIISLTKSLVSIAFIRWSWACTKRSENSCFSPCTSCWIISVWMWWASSISSPALVTHFLASSKFPFLACLRLSKQ